MTNVYSKALEVDMGLNSERLWKVSIRVPRSELARRGAEEPYTDIMIQFGVWDETSNDALLHANRILTEAGFSGHSALAADLQR